MSSRSFRWMLVAIWAVLACVWLSGGTMVHAQKPRYVVMTDMTHDDDNSLVRLLYYANDIDIAAIIVTPQLPDFPHNSTAPWNRAQQVLNAYDQIDEQLRLHDAAFPTAAYLRGITKPGRGALTHLGTSSERFWDFIGSGRTPNGELKDSEGSDFLQTVFSSSDPRPIHVGLWGGPITLVQALWKFSQTHSAAETQALLDKLHIYGINLQDITFDYFINLDVLRTDFRTCHFRDFPAGTYGGQRVRPAALSIDFGKFWRYLRVITAGEVNGHGAMSNLYDSGGEGDTPSFLHLLSANLNLNDPRDFTMGSWGGRFVFLNNRVGPTTFTDCGSNDREWDRWIPAAKNSFLARLDWGILAPAQCNHDPVAVINGNTAPGLLRIRSGAGSVVTLDGRGSSDRDRHALTYAWWQYTEADSYGGTVAISGVNGPVAQVTVPSDIGNGSIHVVLEVKDNGSPNLVAYRRAIIGPNVTPGTTTGSTTGGTTGGTSGSGTTGGTTGGGGSADLVVTSVSWTPAAPAAGNAVTFSAAVENRGTAATPAGTVIGVGFSVDGNQVTWGVDNASGLAAGATRTIVGNGPSSFTWTAVAGSHSVAAYVDDVNRIAESNEGNNQREVSLVVGGGSTGGTTTGGGVTGGGTTGSVQGPYQGVRAAVPGKIEAENFDVGGQGVAYNDSDAVNSGGQYRTSEGVDLERTTDTGGGVNVGWIAAGEWIEYSANVAVTGPYTLRLRVARQPSGTGTVRLLAGPAEPLVDRSGAVTIPSTGGWQTWQTVEARGIVLNAGNQLLRVQFDSADVNVNWLELVSEASAGTGGSATGGATTGTTTTGGSTTGTGSGADLIVTDIAWDPATPAAGQAVTFSITVRNQGGAPTPAGTAMSFPIFVDDTFVTWGADGGESLAAGASRTLVARGPETFTWTATAGEHVVRTHVDDLDRIVESNNGNNVRSETLTVGSGSTPGLRGEYFAGTALAGSPALVRTDATVDFDWASGSPGTGIGVDQFSVRWTGLLDVVSAGTYQFQTLSDDGVRLWINDALVIDNWTDHAPTVNTSGSISLSAGTRYAIRLEYYERGGGATCRLRWISPGNSTAVAIPASRLFQ